MKKSGFLVIGMATAALLLGLAGCGDKPGGGTGGQKVTGDLAFPALTQLNGDKVVVFGTNLSMSEKDRALLKNEYGLTPEFINVPASDQNTRLATLVMTDKSPDIAVFGRSGFNCITKGLAQPIDAYIDLSHPYYRDLQEAYALTEWSGGQHYKLIRNLVKLGGMLYNTKMLEDAGQPDLWELYKKNEWTWDSFREISRELAADTNGDGENDVFAFSMFRPQMFIHTTGKPWGTLDAKTMTVQNNVRDSDVARAMNLLYDMINIDKSGTPTMECLKEFSEERVAMILYDMNPLMQPEVVKIAEKGHLGLVPLPRDPKVDTYYTYAYIADDIIPKGAKNPQGAIAYNAVIRYGNLKENNWADTEAWLREYAFTDAMIEKYNDIHKIGQGVTPIFEQMEDLGYNTSWDCLYNKTPWVTAIKERESETSAWLADLLEEQEVEAPTGPKDIELFERYTAGADEPLSTPKLYPVSDGSPNYKIYLDTEQAKQGKYAARIQYSFSGEEVPYGGFKKNLNSTWNTNNTMTLWAKGDGGKQTVTIEFTAGDVPWQYVLTIDGSEGKVYEIPLSDFALPDWYEEKKDLDLSVITSISFLFEGQGADRCLYMDDIRVIRK